MLFEVLLDLIFSLVYGLFSAMPNIYWTVDEGAMSTFLGFISVVLYFLPVKTFVTLFGIVLSIILFKVFISIIKTIWDLLPFA